MLWARSRGCTVYDLWGIPDEVRDTQYTVRSTQEGGERRAESRDRGAGTGDLWGVYRFKQGFGGRVVRWAGAFDYVYRPTLYWLGSRLLPWLRGRIPL
jgi:lipid II:glycine glycyltransferase (peptidoglycan interpeptide bridge formation enzyme)